jgi:hypothetical protein
MARAAAKSRSRRAEAGSSRGQSKRDGDDPILITAGSEIIGLVLIGLCLLATLALSTYSPQDPIGELVEVANGAGPVGATIAGGLLRSLGAGAIILVAACAFLGGRLMMSLGLPGPLSRFWVGAIVLVPTFAVMPPLLFNLAPETVPWVEPGWLGAEWSRLQTLLFGPAGALILTLFLLAVGVLSLTGISTGTTLAALGRAAAWAGGWAMFVGDWLLTQLHLLAGRLVVLTGAAGGQALRGFQLLRESVTSVGVWREQRARRTRVKELREPEVPFEDEIAEAASQPDEVLPPIELEIEPERPTEAPTRARRGGEEPDIVDHDEQRNKTRKPEQETFHFNDKGSSGPFELPPTALFTPPPENARSYDRESLLMNSKILEKKLADFGVTGRVVRVHPGPVITMYEYEPAAGIKVNRIVNLTDDLAMSLRAISIRIIAPLPGKSVVGIEVPNPDRETVYLQEMLESESFRKTKGRLAIAMGKDIFGNSVTSDLAKMPHLLVAGSTGTGKSVFLNSLLCSLLCRATPNELKLLMVDPKMLELSIYDGIPHLIADVVTSPKRAAAALQGVVRKMEERYQMMSATGVRNIEQFNEKARKSLAEGEEALELGIEVERLHTVNRRDSRVLHCEGGL